jgi:hypothetical protein
VKSVTTSYLRAIDGGKTQLLPSRITYSEENLGRVEWKFLSVASVVAVHEQGSLEGIQAVVWLLRSDATSKVRYILRGKEVHCLWKGLFDF